MRLVMMGTGTFAEPTFAALLAGPHPVVGLVTQPDRDTGKARGSTRQVGAGMAVMAERASVPVIRPESINAPDGVAALRGWNADVLVVAAYGQILSPEVIATPAIAAINVHASLLPKYRGAAPVAWAILKGDADTGVTIIRIVPTLDGGEMLAQESTPIGPDETTGELEARLAAIGARMAMDTVQRLAAGEVSGQAQDPALVTRARRLRKEDGLLDWTKPADEVKRRVRAVQPWPTPYSYLRRPVGTPMRLILPSVTVGHPALAGAAPGTVEEQSGELWVACGQATWLRLDAIHPAGKRRLTTAEFLRGHPKGAGWRLGAET